MSLSDSEEMILIPVATVQQLVQLAHEGWTQADALLATEELQYRIHFARKREQLTQIVSGLTGG